MNLGEFRELTKNYPDDAAIFFETDYFDCIFYDLISDCKFNNLTKILTLVPRCDVVKKLKKDITENMNFLDIPQLVKLAFFSKVGRHRS